jgi:hypothetical protein
LVDDGVTVCVGVTLTLGLGVGVGIYSQLNNAVKSKTSQFCVGVGVGVGHIPLKTYTFDKSGQVLTQGYFPVK